MSAVFTPPAALAPENIPLFLRNIPRWVGWRAGPPKPDGKFAKVPVSCYGRKVSANDPANWLTYDAALGLYDRGVASGVGIVLCGDPVGTWGSVLCGAHQWLVALDFDGVVDDLGPVKKVRKSMPGIYSEVSPSGKGVRMLGLSRTPPKGGNAGCGREMYAHGRFVTITGARGKGDILDFTEKLSELHDDWFPFKAPALTGLPALSGFASVPGLGQGHAPVIVVAPEPESDEAIARVRSQLAYIPANCGYERWRNIIWSLLSTGWKCASGLAREWSESAPDRYDLQVFETLVTSYRPDGGISLGTVVHYAREGGWTFDAGLRRDVQRRENAVIGAGEEFSPQPEVLTVSEMLERFIYLADGSRVFDTKYPKHVLSLVDFRNAFAASSSSINTGAFTTAGLPKSKRVSNCQTWLDSPQRLSAFGTTFDASAGVYATDPNGKHCVNMWTGFDRSIDPEGADIGIVLEQINWLFKDRADDFLNWIAHIEQCPGVLPHAMWLHISSYTGTGRNAIARLLSRVFPGHAAMSLALERVLDSGFNEELSSKVLAVVDEIRMGGKEQWRHSEALKQLVTAQVRHINTKYGRKSIEANACRFLVFSNHRNALPIDDTDRRIEVVICDDKARDAAHYTRLYRAVDDVRVVAGFAQFLKGRDLSSYNPGAHARKTASKEQVMAVSASDEYAALREFTATYTPPLATAERLMRAAGVVNAFSGEAYRFKHALLDAGWQKVGRVPLKGGRTVVYAKRENAGQWTDRAWDSINGLPACDGGVLAWDEVTY